MFSSNNVVFSPLSSSSRALALAALAFVLATSFASSKNQGYLQAGRGRLRLQPLDRAVPNLSPDLWAALLLPRDLLGQVRGDGWPTIAVAGHRLRGVGLRQDADRVVLRRPGDQDTELTVGHPRGLTLLQQLELHVNVRPLGERFGAHLLEER